MKPEFMPQSQGILNVSESSDLKESFKELNEDIINDEGFTSIDMRTRLTASQIPALASVDLLCHVGVYPEEFNRIGRLVKRMSVSLKGQGRNDMVSIAQGNRELVASKGQSIVERAGN